MFYKSANIWVKIPLIPTDTEIKIKIYYGNQSSTRHSNGGTTFEFFDDFNSLLGWDSYGNHPKLSILDEKSVLTIEGWGEIVRPVLLQSPNYALKIMSKLTSGIEAFMPFFGFGQSERTGNEDNAYQFGYNVYRDKYIDDIRIFKNNYHVANAYGDILHTVRTGWIRTEIKAFDGTLTQKVNDSNKGIHSIKLKDTNCWKGIIPKEMGIIIWNDASYAIDWILIRKYSDPEPTIVISLEVLLDSEVPNILVSIASKESFKMGSWEKLDIRIVNVGERMAKDIKINLLGPIETNGDKKIQILDEKGGQLDFVIGIKPTEPGNVPLKVEITFFDQKGLSYEMKEEAFISVAKESETISMRQTPIINIGSIGSYVGEQVDKSTKIDGSQIIRSNVGVGARKCPECGREVDANEKFCLECGARL